MTGTLFTLGETLAVFLSTDSPSPRTAVEYCRVVAGSEANVATACAHLGHDAILVTRVGHDPLGDSVANQLSEWGVGEFVLRDSRPTGVLVRGPHGVDAVHLRQGSAATALSVQDVEAAWRSEVSVVFVTGITAVRSLSARRAVERAVELARANGAIVVVDPNYRSALGDPAAFAEALSGLRGRADIAIGDRFELALLAGTEPEDAVERLLGTGCRVVVVKDGAAGAIVHRTDGSFHQPSVVAAVRDTVGAGDAFAAGFISGFLDQLTFEECAARAAVVASRVVETMGDVGAVEGIRAPQHPLLSDVKSEGQGHEG
ncbi:sugar kinase [Microbacterium sp. Leaf159]|uniref:sugar kinase n=1 Tax=Microbacterium sp. Leaf159 TaxID=1736279 RepID=UPI0006FA2505|nr:sugar kinase [Microbacterium sp. Leaf159]KQR39418.1 hypothetical protein ASF80_08385 [Microbacterium sp. Leaf159]